MEFDDIRIVLDVARGGSFAEAARRRNADPSLVSRVVQAVERELGTRLFQRSTRRLTVTDAGSRFIEHANGLIEGFDRMSEDMRTQTQTPGGTVRVTASVAFGTARLVPLLGMLQADYPGLRIDLVLTDARLDLVAERIDLAIRLGPRIQADLVGTKLFDTRHRVCASPGYLRAHGAIDTPSALSKRGCILLALPDYQSRWRFRDHSGAVTDVPVAGDIMMSSPLAVRDGALAGLGPALLAEWLVRSNLEDGSLVDLFPDRDVTATDFETAAWLLYPTRLHLPRRTRAVADFLIRHLR